MNCVIKDQTGTLSESDIDQFIKDNRQILEQVKKGDAEYAGSLGWLNVDEWAGEKVISVIEALAAGIRADAEVFVLIGIGGSNNAARAVIEAIGRHEGSPEIIYAGNNISSDAIKEALRKCENKSVYVNCIAKNFETLEPGIAFRVFRQMMKDRYGGEAYKRIITTGDPGSGFESLSHRAGYTFLPFPPNIGGRFSALSYVGLLPMAVAGVDIRSLASGARAMENQLKNTGTEKNAAFRYAVARNLLYRQGYCVELMAAFEPRLNCFFKWWVQLFAESEGKEEKGIFPVAAGYTEELHAIGQYVQAGVPMIFETFLEIRREEQGPGIAPDDIKDHFEYLDGMTFEEINSVAYQATVSAHSARLPCVILSDSAIDAEGFGKLFYFFEFACYLSGKILGINPFDQPGVEAYKNRMFRSLGKES